MTDRDGDADALAAAASEFLLYTAPDGDVRVHVLLRDETVWLPQKGIAELFAVGVPAISKHLTNIFDSNELDRRASVSKMEIVRREGQREVAREVEFQLFPFWKQLPRAGSGRPWRPGGSLDRARNRARRKRPAGHRRTSTVSSKRRNALTSGDHRTSEDDDG